MSKRSHSLLLALYSPISLGYNGALIMRNVICAWCDTGTVSFENHVPLHFIGKRNVLLDYDNNIDVLFLDGYDLLNEEYREKLKSVGYRLHNVKSIYHAISRSYPDLSAFNGFETKCFLRWLVISTYFPGDSIVHYDGDVVFNENPSIISASLKGKTFVLQGCPALTCISDPAWFSQYEEQLKAFVDNITEYSQKAWLEREGWEISHGEKWAGSRFREIISSDQDLLSHLIHTDKIIQSRPLEIMNSLHPYALFENPLYLHSHMKPLLKYKRMAGVDYLNDKRVLIWHMQSSFVRYLGKFIFTKRSLTKNLKRISNDLEKKDINYYLQYLYLHYFHGKRHSRLDVYRYFFEEHDFSEILTDMTWWKEGLFA
jgi:hypothetical protein